MRPKYWGASAIPLGAGQKKRRVLVVDDDLRDLLRYSAILQHEGYDVRSIPSHKEAADCVRREQFDLIIVSQGTAVFEGRAVLARALEKNKKLPVLVLSRSNDADCYLEAMQMGASDYREKPLAASELAEIAAWHLNSPDSQAA